MLHPSITGFLEVIFGDTPIGMQSLSFTHGSQQPAHMDFPYVVSRIPSHLAAAWIPLEDVHPDAGPLFDFVGSHRMPKFNWGNGIIYDPVASLRTPVEFAEWLDGACRKLGYKAEELLIKKGDVLVCHAALVHGGTRIKDPGRTRKSYVCHYSSKTGYPTHRAKPGERPTEFRYGNALCYGNPSLTSYEDFFKEGARF